MSSRALRRLRELQEAAAEAAAVNENEHVHINGGGAGGDAAVVTPSAKKSFKKKRVRVVPASLGLVFILIWFHAFGMNMVDRNSPSRDLFAYTVTVKRFPRILLYITTHVSGQHIQFLERCWPFIVKNTKLVAMSDILIFSTNARDQNASEAILAMVNELLMEADTNYTLEYRQNRKATLVVSENPGYQAGANLALKEAALHDWFDGYEWIVRINPDVLIYNDTWILDIMTQDQDASAIFMNCYNNTGTGEEKVQTDFMAFRPEVFPMELYGNMSNLNANAEGTATEFFRQFLPAESIRWLPIGVNRRKQCRVGWQKGWGSPVIHDHDFLATCPKLPDIST